MKRALLLSLTVLTLSSCADPENHSTVETEVVVHDAGFLAFFDRTPVVELLASDLGWAEGPVWSRELDALLFSDVAGNKVYRWSPASGLSEFLSPSGHEPDGGPLAWRGSNGLAVDPQGQLLLAQQGSRRLSRMRTPLSEPASDFDILVSAYQENSLNSPNDLVVSESGDVYFTDPPYGLDGFENSPAIELDFFGVFRLGADGELSLVSRSLAKPNGIALRPDQRTLLVGNSEPGDERIIAIDLDAVPGEGETLFFDTSGLQTAGDGSIDGMVLHPDGHLFTSIPGGIALLSPDGELLGELALGQVTNLALGARCESLFVTMPGALLKIGLKAICGPD